MFQRTQQARLVCGLVLMVLASGRAEAAPKTKWVTAPVGAVTVRGSATTSPSGRITVSGEGTDIWSTADGFQFVYQRLTGDQQILANVTALQNTDGWAKGGLMIRQALTAVSAHASLLMTPSNGIVFEKRTTAGGLTTRVGVTGTAPAFLRLTRTGQTMTASVSSDGMSWTNIGTQDVSMSGDVYVGLAVTSHSPGRLTTASFEKVALSVPPPMATTPPSGPVAAWSFDDGVGSVARASIGGLDGVISGATWTAGGKNAGALVFNGIDNKVTVSPAAALNLTTGMTVEGWVYPTVLNNWRSVAAKEGSNDLAYGLYANDVSGKPEGVVNTGAGHLATFGTGTLPVNVWSHLAATFDGTMQRLFVNGVQVGSLPVTGTLVQTPGAFRIGGNSIWGEWFSGAIDDLRVYDRALSATEIQTDMNTAVAPPPADTTLPTVAISTPVTGQTVSATVGVVATATDDIGVASVQFLLDGANFGSALTAAPYTVTWNTKDVDNGTHLLTAVVRDLAGNANVSADVTVTVSNADTTAPTVAISGPAGGSTLSGSVTVTATASDNVGVASVQFRLDGADLGGLDTTAPYSVAWNTSAATSGPHTLTAVARDAAGNANVSADVTVTVSNADTTAPTVAISGPAGGSTVSGSVTVTATASDNVGVASVQFRLDGADLGGLDTTAPYSVAWNTSAATSGPHTLTAVARDAAGNVTVSQAVAVTVADTSMPTVSISAPASGSTVSGSVTVTATASDNVGVASVQFRLDGANLGGLDTTAPYSVAWNTSAATSGPHTLTAVARDAAGNVTVSQAVAVTVADTSMPTVSISAPASGSTVSGSVTVTATASDNVGVASVQFRLDGADLGGLDTTAPYSVAWNTSAATSGPHTLTAVARDAAGNVTVSQAVAVTVADTSMPTVSISAPASGSTVSGSVTVTATASDNVGVASVQFRVNGANLGSPDTAARHCRVEHVPCDERHLHADRRGARRCGKREGLDGRRRHRQQRESIGGREHRAVHLRQSPGTLPTGAAPWIATHSRSGCPARIRRRDSRLRRRALESRSRRRPR